jgi:hypothetical protein
LQGDVRAKPAVEFMVLSVGLWEKRVREWSNLIRDCSINCVY